jgi:hypothetical protein
MAISKKAPYGAFINEFNLIRILIRYGALHPNKDSSDQQEKYQSPEPKYYSNLRFL